LTKEAWHAKKKAASSNARTPRMQGFQIRKFAAELLRNILKLSNLDLGTKQAGHSGPQKNYIL